MIFWIAYYFFDGRGNVFPKCICYIRKSSLCIIHLSNFNAKFYLTEFDMVAHCYRFYFGTTYCLVWSGFTMGNSMVLFSKVHWFGSAFGSTVGDILGSVCVGYWVWLVSLGVLIWQVLFE